MRITASVATWGWRHWKSTSAAPNFLMLEYAGGDKLYVPVTSLHLVSRYTGSDPETAPLHRLGSQQWEKARRKAAKQVRDVAVELLDLYSRRQARKGFAFSLDEKLYAEFSSGFPYEETPDQQSAIDAVIGDLASDLPMDRVVCGDVGFGKTEVALRAAFIAVQAGRQVALLVPTTLLAQQHYLTFTDRLVDWPVKVGLLSRFRTGKQSNEVLELLANGRVDIVIGTHRLLQKDIRFKNLGLVIIDEEQRFGVRQKERLKQLRTEVDLLTLTATPIPRTLNMAMSGIRDLSIIATPPARRMAVKTLISEWDKGVIREALHREIQRGGQVFFLHNEVRSIERIAREIQELAPNARLAIAHGQMRERELETVMLDFYRQRFNILVCTTIIESGLDVPTANTIVINRADRFGLAQLHQLRGRVGRSHHRAYAYLIVPDKRSMTADARKRLEAIASLEELGAGFTLATHDLEIRGAGELLGAEQSGQINQVGFSLYSDMLARAVEALRKGEDPDLEQAIQRGIDIELHIPALIPDTYLGDVQSRLTLYKRIASARDSAALRELQANTIVINRADRFGLAQLHQLRGRVGRSHHRAYAYLIVPDKRSMTADARKRLEAIASLEELGAGFTLATHDLEIRGAGELLGAEQSGQINQVGFSLYSDMLARAVEALRKGEDPNLDQPLQRGIDIELHIPALIPDTYLGDVQSRLTLYKRIASARDSAALRNCKWK